MKRYVLLHSKLMTSCLIVIITISCSKIIHKESEYSGTVINKVTEDPYEGLRVILFERDFRLFRNGIGGGHEEAVAASDSDGDGKFTITYDTKEGGRYSYNLKVSNIRVYSYQNNETAPRLDIVSKNKDVSELLIEVIPSGSFVIKPSRALVESEYIDGLITHNVTTDQNPIIMNKSIQNISVASSMGTWTINYKYDSDGDTTNWDWEKTDTFWVEEGQTTEYVIDVDG